MGRLLWVVGAFAAAACGSSSGSPDDGGFSDIGPSVDAPEQKPEPVIFAVTSVEPNHGPFTGGNRVTVRGTGFGDIVEVYFGDRLAEPAFQEVIDPTRISLITPPGDVGPAEVKVIQDGESALDPDAYLYDAFYLEPNRGSIVGGTLVNVIGQGTTFGPLTSVTLDGVPLQDVNVVSATQITGTTAPSTEGLVDVAISAESGTVTVEDGFEYYEVVDPMQGGLGGGIIESVFTVTVVDGLTGDFVPGAYVIVGPDETTPLQGVTDAGGQISFTGDFTPPIDVTATAVMYTPTSIVAFDASEAIVFILPIIPPMPGPGVGIFAGHIEGLIQFGGATGLGSEEWTLVPDPGPGQYRCARAETTQYTQFSPTPDPGPNAWIRYEEDTGATAWAFDLFPVRIGNMAAYAIAGHCIDGADGLPIMVASYAMGVQRGLIVGPAETVEAGIIMDIPLDQTIEIEWVAPPPIAFPGPDAYTLDVLYDLGGDGFIVRRDVRRAVDPETLSFTVGAQAAISGAQLFDASYMFVAAAATTFFGGGPTPVDGFDTVGNPFSVVTKRSITDVGAPVVIDGFIGMPTPVDPLAGGTITGLHMEWNNPGAPSSLNQVLLVDALGGLAWWLITEGASTSYDLPDLTVAGGFDPLPPQFMTWIIWEIHKPDYDFNLFTFGDVYAETLWDAYAADAFLVSWP